MEFATLVAPGGALWRAWVAAHWERRLKRHDYLAADVKAIASLVIERLGAIPLRCVGRLLLGACRLLRWKVQQLEEEAAEVRAGLLACAAAGPSLPCVASLPESALTLKLPPGEVSWWGLDLEFAGGEQLQLLDEPELPVVEVRTSLEEGRRHVAPLETITLGPEAPVQPPVPTSEGPADAFGTPSAEERAAMDLLSRGPFGGSTRGPGPGGDDAPPPLDFLLGRSGTGASLADLRPGSGSLLGGVGPHAAGGARDVSLGLPGDPALMDVLGGEDVLRSTTPRRLERRLEDEFASPAYLGEGPGFARLSTQSSYLARMLDFSPEVPEGAEEGPAAAAPAAAQAPRKQRRKRFKQWLDDQTEISKAEYHDTSAITREHPLCDYRLYLPHQAPHIGLTTTLSDICPLLCEPLLHAPAVGQKRRRALTEASSRPAPAVREPRAGVPEAECAPRAEWEGGELGDGLPADPLASLPPTPVRDEEEQERLLSPWAGGGPLSPRSEGADESAIASPLRSLTASPAPGGEDEGVLGSAEDLFAEVEAEAAEAEASPLPFAPLSPLLDFAADAEAVEPGLDLAEPTPGDVLGAEPSAGEGPAAAGALPDAPLAAIVEARAEDLQPPPKVRRMIESPTETMAQQPERTQGCLRDHLGALETDASLLGLCSASSWGAEDVARSFMELLTLHMDGGVSLTQAEPYGDVVIGRGPDWPATPGLRSADA